LSKFRYVILFVALACCDYIIPENYCRVKFRDGGFGLGLVYVAYVAYVMFVAFLFGILGKKLTPIKI